MTTNNRPIRKFLYAGILMLTISCNYKRDQVIPKDIQVLSKEEICSFSSYKVFKYVFSDLKNTSMDKWQEGLICEGYSKKPMTLKWLDILKLPTNEKNSMAYFYYEMESCGYSISSNSIIDNKWIAACRTEVKGVNPQEQTYIYHKIFLLDFDGAVMYEIQNLD